MSTEDEMLERQIQLEEELKSVRRQIADFTAAAALFEEGSVCNIDDARFRTLIARTSLAPLVSAISVLNVDWFLDAGVAINSARNELSHTVAQLTTELEELRSRPPKTQQTNDQMVERAVNTRLEERLRILSSDLYERTHALPRRLRETVSAFSQERAAFQLALNERRRQIDSLLASNPPIDATLGVTVAKLARTDETSDASTLHELCRLIREVQTRIEQNEACAKTHALEVSRRRNEYRKLIDQGSELTREAEELERLATLFVIPCPVEVARQLNETKSRLLLSDDGTTDRAADMLRFQPNIPEPPEALEKLFQARVEASALLMRLEANPAHLFNDACARSTAIERLFVLLALLTAEDKGFGKKTYISILSQTGLIPEEELDELDSVIDGLLESSLFERERFKRGYVHKPTEECRKAASATLRFARDPQTLEYALEFGKKQHWATWRQTRYGGRKDSDNA